MAPNSASNSRPDGELIGAVLARASGRRRARRAHPRGGALIFARLNAATEGFGSEFVEAHPLDAKTARRVPKRMVGRTLVDRRDGRAARPAGVISPLYVAMPISI